MNSKTYHENQKQTEVLKADFAEMAIDRVSDLLGFSELLQDIPAIKAVKTAREVLEQRKLKKFLSPLSTASKKDTKEYVTKQLQSQRKRIEFAETFLSIALNAENNEKASILGFLVADAVRGKIDPDVALRCASIVSRTHLSDLHYAGEFKYSVGPASPLQMDNGQHFDNHVAANLNQWGFFTRKNERPPKRAISRNIIAGSNAYHMTAYGELIVEAVQKHLESIPQK